MLDGFYAEHSSRCVDCGAPVAYMYNLQQMVYLLVHGEVPILSWTQKWLETYDTEIFVGHTVDALKQAHWNESNWQTDTLTSTTNAEPPTSRRPIWE